MDKKELLKIDNQICFKLYTSSRFIIQLYTPLLDELDLTYLQYLVMLVLWEYHELSVKQIGEILYLDSGTLTPLLKKLEKKNLVIRSRNQDDERIVNISLTNKSKELKKNALTIPEKILCKSNMNINDLLEIRELLDKLIKLNKA
ncbi:MAG: MarR family transcriptional regulator [Candidatus Sericytochromatia bacterium]